MENDLPTQPKTRITPQEYLELERKAEIKSEYLDGQMFAMSGAMFEHNQIVLNIATELNTQLKDRLCTVLVANMWTKVQTTGLYTYPDIVALCGEAKFEDQHMDTLINPQVIIEVLSQSTESYDRGRKFAHYRSLDSSTEYLLVSQTECRIERYARQGGDSWIYSECADLNGSIELTSVAARLSLPSVYHKVDFERAKSKNSAR